MDDRRAEVLSPRDEGCRHNRWKAGCTGHVGQYGWLRNPAGTGRCAQHVAWSFRSVSHRLDSLPRQRRAVRRESCCCGWFCVLEKKEKERGREGVRNYCVSIQADQVGVPRLRSNTDQRGRMGRKTFAQTTLLTRMIQYLVQYSKKLCSIVCSSRVGSAVVYTVTT